MLRSEGHAKGDSESVCDLLVDRSTKSYAHFYRKSQRRQMEKYSNDPLHDRTDDLKQAT